MIIEIQEKNQAPLHALFRMWFMTIYQLWGFMAMIIDSHGSAF